MIVVDGDSLAFVAEDQFARFKWPVLLGDAVGMPVFVEATHKATAAICRDRAWRAIERRPKWYVLCIGQWAQNHETSQVFLENLRDIVEAMHIASVNVVLMTPTRNIGYLHAHAHMMRMAAKIYRTSLCDVYARTCDMTRDDPFFTEDGTVRCHPSSDGHRKILDWLLEDVKW